MKVAQKRTNVQYGNPIIADVERAKQDVKLFVTHLRNSVVHFAGKIG